MPDPLEKVLEAVPEQGIVCIGNPSQVTPIAVLVQSGLCMTAERCRTSQYWLTQMLEGG